MALTLRSDMRLEPRKSDGYVALRREDPRQTESLVFRLHPYQGLTLALFDGQRTPDEVIDIVNSVLHRSRDNVRRLVTTVMQRYRQFLVEAGPETTAARARVPAVDPVECLFPTTFNFRYIRDAAPSALLWVVTEYCDKKCRYCFMNAIYTETNSTPDIDLPFPRMKALIEEAASIGVQRMVLSGGEPFLRSDLVEIIGLLVANRIDVIPITKHRIVGDRMTQLAATGLRELHVSLDSSNPSIVADLVGIPDAMHQMIDTIRGAVAHGIRVVLRPVVADINVREMEGLITLAIELGVSKITFSKYGQGCGRHEDDLRPTPASQQWLDEHWPLLQARYRQSPIEIEFDSGTPNAEGDKGCAEGIKGLTFLPNGLTTKCEHWRFDDQLVFGDLRRQSLMQVWNSDRLVAVNFPDREAYAGTICYHCKNLNHCDYIRGRCSMSALVTHGTPYAPDVHCPIGAFQLRLPDEPVRPKPEKLLQIQGLSRTTRTHAAQSAGGVG